MKAFKHLRAFEFAAVTSVVAAAVFGLPLLAADEAPNLSGFDDKYYAEHIILKFQKIGAESSIYDNKTVNSSAFDLVQYMSDTCYRPTQNDIPSCKDKFGSYFNLKATMDSGDLASILTLRPYFFGVDKLFPASPASVAEPELTVDDRSHEIWSVCQEMFSDRFDQSRCFQRNISLVTVRRVRVQGNVYTD